MDGLSNGHSQVNRPPQPSESRRVLSTAMYTLGAIGIIISLAGIVIGIVVLAVWLLINMVGSNKVPFTLQWISPLATAVAIGVLGWIIIKIGGRLRR